MTGVGRWTAGAGYSQPPPSAVQLNQREQLVVWLSLV
jgi:hypothetical protein